MRHKRKMKMPNGYGSIKYLGANRRRPYAVYPPVTEWNGKTPVTPKALGYTETWDEGYEMLVAYNMEKAGKIKVARNVYIDRTPTFAEVYEQFFKEKYKTSGKDLSTASKCSTKSAYKHCSALYDRQMGDLRYDDLQNVVNACPLGESSVSNIISLLHQVYQYAEKYEIVEKDYSKHLYMPETEKSESGEPFSDRELEILWHDKENPVTQMLLIMCYSGFRIVAYKSMTVNLDERYFQGGVKTKAGKVRIVPIHHNILPFVKSRSAPDVLGVTPSKFRKLMYKRLEELGIANTDDGKKHTPHDCRHTFSALCEHYGVNENDRKRMLGHAFKDVTNAVYGHRGIDDLRKEIEKIQVPKNWCC